MEKHILVEMTFGSHLYGTASPTSDKDYKGVYLPAFDDLLLSRFPKSINENTKLDSSEKNTSADTDKETYSLHYFMELAKKGETVALDMLHAPPSAWLKTSWQWEYLVDRKHFFYTKNLSSLVGYARKQASKYGVKGSRLADAKLVRDVLFKYSHMRVSDLMDHLPTTEHCGIMPHDGGTVYTVCGRKLTANAFAHHYLPMMDNFIKEYGERAKQAETNEGVDWKAVSHAFRAAYQVRGILKDGGFTYPLPETDFLRAVKSGLLNFKTDVGPMLDSLMDEVDRLSKESKLPEKVDDSLMDCLMLYLVGTSYPQVKRNQLC